MARRALVFGKLNRSDRQVTLLPSDLLDQLGAMYDGDKEKVE